MRRSWRYRTRPEQSSLSAISLSSLSRRGVRHFNRALLPSPDSFVADLSLATRTRRQEAQMGAARIIFDVPRQHDERLSRPFAIRCCNQDEV